ncbi:hypothetical protein HA402_011283, partial [Bradysia odoriphaga]
AYITCSINIDNIGWIFISGGIANTSMSYLQRWIIKWTGRVPLFTAAYTANIIVIFVWLWWMPNPSTPIVFYLISITWGLADSIFQCQINAIYGILFPTAGEAAFANYRLWESSGIALAYLASNHLCIRPKLYILIAVGTIGMICYYIVEYKEKMSKKTLTNMLENNKFND